MKSNLAQKNQVSVVVQKSRMSHSGFLFNEGQRAKDYYVLEAQYNS